MCATFCVVRVCVVFLLLGLFGVFLEGGGGGGGGGGIVLLFSFDFCCFEHMRGKYVSMLFSSDPNEREKRILHLTLCHVVKSKCRIP